MSDRIFATSQSQNSVLRQLKILVGILILSNIGLGLFGVYVLRAIDQRYSTLIDQTVPSMNELQTLTAWSVEAMRSTNPSLFPSASSEQAEVVQRASSLIERDRDLRSHAVQREWLSLKPGERSELQQTGDAFTRESLEVLQILAAGRNAEAGERREKTLRPIFDRYVAVVTKIADVLEAESLRTSSSLTVQTGSMSQMFLGIASWPVLLMGLFLAGVILFVVGVLLRVTLFRGAES